MMKARMFWLTALLLFALSGCGYTTRSAISNKYRTIYIKPCVNKIDITRETDVENRYRLYRPGLETDITKGISNKFLFDGNLKPVDSDTADLTMTSELTEFRKDPLRYDDNDEVAEYRMNVLVNLKLWDNREDKLVWEENNFTGDTTYFPTTSTLQNVVKKSDAQAVTDSIADLARRIVERAVEEW